MPPEAKAGDFGSRLRQARERRGVGLREIANDTKISMAALEALERNDLSKLPGGIFSRAFVRSYASRIGLDPEETVDEFLRQFPHDSVRVGHASSKRLDDPEKFESDRRTATAVLTLLGISVPVAGLMIYFGSSAGREAPAPGVAAAPAAEARPAPAAIAPLRIGLTVSRDTTVWVTADDQPATPTPLVAGAPPRTFEVRQALVLNLDDAGALSWSVDGVAGQPLGADGAVATLRLTPANYREHLSVR
jgi:transcriptional regulator with XRE-family HTH domain